MPDGVHVVKRRILMSLILSAGVAVAFSQSTTQPASQKDIYAGFRAMLCAEHNQDASSKPFPPDIGCVTFLPGSQATGSVDGHRLDISVAADGADQCRIDGTVVACTGCAGPRVTGCPRTITVLPNGQDHSVTFSFQRKVEGDRYAYNMNAWNAFLERQKKGTPLPPDTAPIARPPIAIPPTAPGAFVPVIPPQPPTAFVPGASMVTDGPAALTSVGWEAQGDYSRYQLANLDALVQTLSAPDQVTDSGMSKLAGVIEGLDGFVTAWNQWDDDLAKIEKWRREQPDSPTIDVVEAVVWRAWAWHVRGGGYGNTVKPEAWKLFTAKIANANAALERCTDASCRTPIWYQMRLGIARDAGWDQDRYKELFEEARRQYPWYIPLYLLASDYLSPKWGGSYEAVDAFARQTVKMPPGDDYSLYARIYWSLTGNSELDFDVFHDSQANWGDVKKGFEALMRRYPKSLWNLNAFASFACRAQDRETYGKLRAQMGRTIFPNAWPSNAPVDVCDEQLLGKS